MRNAWRLAKHRSRSEVSLSPAAVTLSGVEMSTAARSRSRFSVRQGKIIRVVIFILEIFHSFGKQ